MGYLDDSLYYDEADRHLHAALHALAEQDPEQMRAEARSVLAIAERWIGALQEAAAREASPT